MVTGKLQTMHDLPSAKCSSSTIKHPEEENDDDWVVVKKQKFAILIPPPSPPSQRTVKETGPKPSSRQPKAAGRRGQPPGQAPRPPSSSRAYGVGKIGAANVVNLRIRAMNLERELLGLGGLRRWPPLRGLDRIAAVFEWGKFSRCQLANLTMGKLKDMGMNSVGPRRKLIHAIDLLCQPYFTKDSHARPV